MRDKLNKDSLIVPVYLNEKIVLDMLAIIEDGFSMVSEVVSSHETERDFSKKMNSGISTSSILSKLVKIQFDAEGSSEKKNSDLSQSKRDKVHTSVSLLSKLRTYLVDNNILSYSAADKINIDKIQTGDFIEISGELQKNPMIDFFEKFVSIFKMAEIFTEAPQLGSKSQTAKVKAEEQKTLKQIKEFLGELNTTGTIDFIVENDEGTTILSTQEQYMQNDNISELLGGKFRVLGKVIKIASDENDKIDLLRKTTLSILDDNTLNEFLTAFKSDDLKEFKLPEVRAVIKGPAIIIIPIAIYA